MTFRVGQKVVCVDASPSFGRPWMIDPPIEGSVYSVCGVLELDDPLTGVVVCLQFAEIKNSEAWEGAYRASRFRPAVERKTDISIFTAMLTEEKIGASA